MPAPQVLALLKASGPARAAVTLLTFPADRINVLLAAMPLDELSRLLAAATPAQRRQLLPAMTVEKVLDLLAGLANGQAADVLAAVPAAQAMSLLNVAPAHQASRILSVLPESTRAAVDTSLPSDRATELHSTLYEQQVAESVARISPRAARLPSSTCDLIVAVLHRFVQVAVRYRGPEPVGDQDVATAARTADWNQIVGLLVVSNTEPTAAALRHTSAVQAAGYPLELLRWTDDGDDGALKRALVRLSG